MSGLLALGLAVAAIPFVLPLISYFITRALRERVRDLEEQVGRQSIDIQSLTTQLRELRMAAQRPAPTPAAVPPIVAPPPIPSHAPPAPVVPAPQPVAAKPAAPPPPARPAASHDEPVKPRPQVPPPPVPPRPPSPWIPRINWSFDWEQLVGVKLFSAIAGVALVLAAIFFLRYSIDHGWLQPPVRVAIGVLTAVGLLIACERTAARKYPITANALDAAAIAILFATFFSAHALWHLIPATVAFVLLALVTATAVLLSVRHESLFVAVLGLAGGFATPVLLSTGENRPISLFAYLLLLNVGLAWVAYRRGWTVLSTLSLVLTTLYQWGWVVKFLAVSPLPMALGIFIVFPLVGYAGFIAAQSRPAMREHAGSDAFEWTALIASALPLAFAVYLAVVRPYGERYGLLFGFLFLINAGLFAIAIMRGRELLHALGALAVLVVMAAWLAGSYVPGAWLAIVAIAIGFMVFYLVAPLIAEWAKQPLEGDARHTIYAAPLLMFVFPVLARLEPATSSPSLFFAILFVLLVAFAWRTLQTGASGLYYGAVFFALATEAMWSATHLTLERVRAAMVIYTAFGVLYLAVPLIARRRKQYLEPALLGGVALNLSLLLLLFLASGPFAAPAMWGLAVLLLIIGSAIYVESAATRSAPTALAGCVLSWMVLLFWWSNAHASVGVLPALWMVAGLTLLTLAGHAWAMKKVQKSDGAEAAVRDFRWGSWLALAAYGFLLATAANDAWAVPPWPLFGVLAVVTLSIGTASLSDRNGALHIASTIGASTVLLTWILVAQGFGYAVIGVGAEATLVAFALTWIALARRFGFERMAAAAAGLAIVLAELSLAAMLVAQPPQPPLSLLVSGHVVGLAILLALASKYEWPAGATSASVLAAIILVFAFGIDALNWKRLLVLAVAMYGPFALYPLLLGSRARTGRDPYIAAILASVWCFVGARYGVVHAGYAWMVGVVPVTLGAVTTLHVRQLLRLEPKGSRDLGRLALVAGTALAFATVTIPLQLSQQWITIGWALEGAAVAWLYRRVPHRGLLYAAAGLLGAVFARLALNPEVFRYEPRGSMRIFNWYLYAYLMCAAAMFLAAWWLSKTDDEVTPQMPRLRYVMSAAGGILLFLLLNIEIADFYATGPEIMFRFGGGIAQDLTYTIGWLIFGLLTLAAGIMLHSRVARVSAVALITVTTLKCFLYDLGSLGGLYRVGAFVGLAISLTLVSLALQKFVLTAKQENAR